MSESFMSGEVFDRAVQAAADALEQAPFLDSTEAFARIVVATAAPIFLEDNWNKEDDGRLIDALTQRAERAEAEHIRLLEVIIRCDTEITELHDDLHARDCQYTNLAFVAGRLAAVLQKVQDDPERRLWDCEKEALAAYEEAYPHAGI